ncbi:hypothetical protein ACWEOE_05310 [Amycolatopsis sp. NPDC004368]
MQRLNEGAQEFKKLAQSGGFSISDEGFQAYEKVCNQVLNGYSEMLGEAKQLAQQAKMGGSDYAMKVAAFNAQVADGTPDALIPNLTLLQQGFEQILDALSIARDNYYKTEDEHRQTFSKGLEAGS